MQVQVRWPRLGKATTAREQGHVQQRAHSLGDAGAANADIKDLKPDAYLFEGHAELHMHACSVEKLTIYLPTAF